MDVMNFEGLEPLFRGLLEAQKDADPGFHLKLWLGPAKETTVRAMLSHLLPVLHMQLCTGWTGWPVTHRVCRGVAATLSRASDSSIVVPTPPHPRPAPTPCRSGRHSLEPRVREEWWLRCNGPRTDSVVQRPVGHTTTCTVAHCCVLGRVWPGWCWMGR